MKLIGFNADEIAGIYTLLGGILHLGNVLFKDVFVDGMDSVDVLNEKGKLRAPSNLRILFEHSFDLQKGNYSDSSVDNDNWE